MQVININGDIIHSHTLQSIIDSLADSNDDILININSYGGSVDEAFAIVDYLQGLNRRIITHTYNAASAATLIMLLANPEDRYISEHAVFIPHFPYLQDLWGTFRSDDLAKLTELMEQYDTKILDYYRSRLSITDSLFEQLIEDMHLDTNLGMDGAMKYGFATKTISEYIEAKGKPVASFREIEVLCKSIQKSNNMNKNKTNWLQKLSAKFSVKAASVLLEDGTTTLYFAEDELAVGVAVFLDEALTQPAPDGEHTLQDGRVITVEAGVVSSILSPDEVIEALSQLVEAAAKKVELLQKENQKLVAKVSELSKLVSGKKVEAPQQSPAPTANAATSPLVERFKTKFKTN